MLEAISLSGRSRDHSYWVVLQASVKARAGWPAFTGSEAHFRKNEAEGKACTGLLSQDQATHCLGPTSSSFRDPAHLQRCPNAGSAGRASPATSCLPWGCSEQEGQPLGAPPH